VASEVCFAFGRGVDDFVEFFDGIDVQSLFVEQFGAQVERSKIALCKDL
jgi:hypothetical protein